MPEYTIQKQNIPIILNEEGDAIAIIFFSKNRDRIINLVTKADEDQIIALFERTDMKIREKKKEEVSSLADFRS